MKIERDILPSDPPNSALFHGRETDAREFVRNVVGRYYVYALNMPDGTPFYIGEGFRNRVFEHVLEARRNHKRGETNPHKCNKIRKLEASGHAIRYGIFSLHDSKIEAEREEGRLIAHFGRAVEGGPLTNIAPGRESGLGIHPESRAKHAATLGHDPSNPARDRETRALNAFMASILPVASTPLKPRSKYHGNRVRHTTGTTRSVKPKPRSAAALAIAASLNDVSLAEGALVPRSFVYAEVPALLENGVANDIVGTGIAVVVPAGEPEQERFCITAYGAAVILGLLGSTMLQRLDLID